VKNIARNSLERSIEAMAAQIQSKPSRDLCEGLHLLLTDLYQARYFPAKETLNQHTERILALESRIKTLEAAAQRKAQASEPRALVARMG
jgi:hypothetical protein